MKTNKALNYVIVGIGVLAIILGIVVIAQSSGTDGAFASFGADFYTYVNKNASRIADNTQTIITVLKLGFGGFFILGGALTATIGLSKIDFPAKKAPKDEAPAVQETSIEASEAPEQ